MPIEHKDQETSSESHIQTLKKLFNDFLGNDRDRWRADAAFFDQFRHEIRQINADLSNSIKLESNKQLINLFEPAPSYVHLSSILTEQKRALMVLREELKKMPELVEVLPETLRKIGRIVDPKPSDVFRQFRELAELNEEIITIIKDQPMMMRLKKMREAMNEIVQQPGFVKVLDEILNVPEGRDLVEKLQAIASDQGGNPAQLRQSVEALFQAKQAFVAKSETQNLVEKLRHFTARRQIGDPVLKSMNFLEQIDVLHQAIHPDASVLNGYGLQQIRDHENRIKVAERIRGAMMRLSDQTMPYLQAKSIEYIAEKLNSSQSVPTKIRAVETEIERHKDMLMYKPTSKLMSLLRGIVDKKIPIVSNVVSSLLNSYEKHRKGVAVTSAQKALHTEGFFRSPSPREAPRVDVSVVRTPGLRKNDPH